MSAPLIAASVNGQPVDVAIIGAEPGAEARLLPNELALIAALERALRGDPAFGAACPGARLVRVDTNRLLAEDEDGRIYLRYAHVGGVSEWWGRAGERLAIDHGRGLVAVPLPGTARA